MEEATDQVVEMLEAMQASLRVPNEQLIVGGFSQGSMAACNAVFTRAVAPGGLVILSGTPVNLQAWKAGMRSRRGLPVFQSHGTDDPLLSFRAAEQLRDEMHEAGLRNEWMPFRGGHEIPMRVLEALGRFVTSCVE
jgi:phospholipase/carboxylesterase